MEFLERILATPESQLFFGGYFIIIIGVLIIVWNVMRSNRTLVASISDGQERHDRAMAQARQDEQFNRREFITVLKEISTTNKDYKLAWDTHNQEASKWRSQAVGMLSDIDRETNVLTDNSRMVYAVLGDLSRSEMELTERVNKAVIPILTDIKDVLVRADTRIQILLDQSPKESLVFQRLNNLERGVNYIIRLVDKVKTDELPTVKLNEVLNLCLLVCLILVVALPVLAQTDPQPVTGTTPPGDDGNNVGGIPLYQFVILTSMVLLAFLYAAYENHSNRKLHLEAIDRLYKSTPPIIRDPAFGLVSGLGDNVLASLDMLAETTAWTDLDDRAQERAAAYWKEVKDRWNALATGIGMAQAAQPKMISVDEAWTPDTAQLYLEARGFQIVPPRQVPAVSLMILETVRRMDDVPPSERDTEPHETRALSMNADKKKWEKSVERCEATHCWLGEPIRGVAQAGYTWSFCMILV